MPIQVEYTSHDAFACPIRLLEDMGGSVAVNEAVTHGVFSIVSPDWQRTIYASPNHDRMWGQSSQVLIDNPCAWLESVHAKDRDAVTSELVRKADGDYSEPTFPRFRISNANGDMRYIAAQAYPIRDISGKIVQVLFLAQDETEHNRAREEWNAARAELNRRQNLAMLAQLTATVSHDLRNPLTVLRASIAVMRRKLPDEDNFLARQLERMDRSVDRCIDITQRILG